MEEREKKLDKRAEIEKQSLIAKGKKDLAKAREDLKGLKKRRAGKVEISSYLCSSLGQTIAEQKELDVQILAKEGEIQNLVENLEARSNS